MTITITLTDAQVASINKLMETSHSETFLAEVQKCLRYGIDNRVYRQGYNMKQHAEAKQRDAELSMLRARLAQLDQR